MSRSTGQRLPIITLAVVAALLAGFVLSSRAPDGAIVAAEETREAAQAFYLRHPEVSLTARDRALLGAKFVDHVAVEQAASGGSVVRQPRVLRERIQGQFDSLSAAASRARAGVSPAWAHGIEPGDRVSRDFIAYGFLYEYEEVIAFALAMVFLLVAGIGIEGAWGSVLFAVFCAAALFAPAFAHAALGSAGGIPFSGASGLLAALLVVYWVRGRGGRFFLPGWVLLPIWLFAEYVIIRGAWFDRLEGLPLAAHGAALLTGLLGAAAVGLLGLEGRRAARLDSSRSEGHPALGLAARAVADEQFDAAWGALSKAWVENPDDDDIVLAWWRLACDQGRADEVLETVLPRIRKNLREGDAETAIQYWFDILHHVPHAEVEARLTTRLAEALIERGDVEAAREALRRAVADTQGLSTALAQRVVRSAREIDPEIASMAAAVALRDADLDPDSREALQDVAGADHAEPEVAEAGDAEDEGALPIEAPPIEALPIELEGRVDTAEAEELEEASPHDAGAEAGEIVSEPALPEADEGETLPAVELGLADDEELAESDPDAEEAHSPGTIDLSEIDPADLSISGLQEETDDGDSADSDEPDPLEDLLDRSLMDLAPEADLAPAEPEDEGVDAPGFSASGLAEEAEPGDPEAEDDPPLIAEAELVDADADADDEEEENEEESEAILEMTEDLLVERESSSTASARSARVLEGVPTRLIEEGLEVDIEGRGLGRIPYERIQAMAVAAVSGLSARPVLVMDLVLNWDADPDEPFKVIRLRGNHFDPLLLSPEAPSPLQALKDVITTLSQRSGAKALPSEAAVFGDPFLRFDDMAQYEQAVLGVQA